MEHESPRIIVAKEYLYLLRLILNTAVGFGRSVLWRFNQIVNLTNHPQKEQFIVNLRTVRHNRDINKCVKLSYYTIMDFLPSEHDIIYWLVLKILTEAIAEVNIFKSVNITPCSLSKKAITVLLYRLFLLEVKTVNRDSVIRILEFEIKHLNFSDFYKWYIHADYWVTCFNKNTDIA